MLRCLLLPAGTRVAWSTAATTTSAAASLWRPAAVKCSGAGTATTRSRTTASRYYYYYHCYITHENVPLRVLQQLQHVQFAKASRAASTAAYLMLRQVIARCSCNTCHVMCHCPQQSSCCAQGARQHSRHKQLDAPLLLLLLLMLLAGRSQAPHDGPQAGPRSGLRAVRHSAASSSILQQLRRRVWALRVPAVQLL